MKRLSGNVLFSARTHKPGYPFRVIVSENGSWQKSLAGFIKDKLKFITINDAFVVDGSEQIIKV